MTADERARIQRRVLRVLTGGQVVGAAALASAITVGGFVIQDLLGDETVWVGLATATITTGTAFMSQTLSRLMSRKGRRPGLQLGYLLASFGGLLAAFGAETGSLALFMAGLFLFGNGQASNLLARYAAADLALSGERGRAMSRILFASTFGAVLGPLAISPAEHAGQAWFEWGKYTGPWVLSALLFGGAMVNTALRLRPDPLVVAGGLRPAGGAGPSTPPLARSLRIIAADRRSRLALLAMVVAQATMVGVMAMTPVHMKLHGHEDLSPYVVSAHIAGMFAFSPFVGRFTDRHGQLAAIRVSGVVLAIASITAALSGDIEQLLFPSMFLIGVGWSFGLIGGSSLLTESVPAAERVSVQGSADLMMSLCGGIAGLASGFIRNALGFHTLASLSTLATLMLVVAAAAYGMRTPRQPVLGAAARQL